MPKNKRMKTDHPLISGTIGTSLMTIFSYGISAYKEKKFEEPKLLSELVGKIIKEKTAADVSGWLMHYTMGCNMAFIFNKIWRKRKINPGIKQGLIAGTFSGILGILIWNTVFTAHPNPPKIVFKRYYGHLLLAHLVFAAGVALASHKK